MNLLKSNWVWDFKRTLAAPYNYVAWLQFLTATEILFVFISPKTSIKLKLKLFQMEAELFIKLQKYFLYYKH